MTTNQLYKELQALGLERRSDYVLRDGVFIAHVNQTRLVELNTEYIGFEELDPILKEKLFNLLVEYARTPIEEREEQKKYYLRLSILGGEESYLNFNKGPGNDYIIASSTEVFCFQAQFTQAEIDKLKEKYNLDSFEQVEVEDE